MDQTLREASGSRAGVLQEIVQRLVEGMSPDRIFLFGSLAWGNATAASDIDLLVIVPESSEPGYKRSQRAYRCVGAVGTSKDLLVMTGKEFETQARVVSSLAYKVKESGKLVYERGEAG